MAFAAAAVVDLLLGPRRFGRGRLDRAPAGVAAGGVRPHLVEADDYAALGRGGVEAFDCPLLRSNSGSTQRRTRSLPGATSAPRPAAPRSPGCASCRCPSLPNRPPGGPASTMRTAGPDQRAATARRR